MSIITANAIGTIWKGHSLGDISLCSYNKKTVLTVYTIDSGVIQFIDGVNEKYTSDDYSELFKIFESSPMIYKKPNNDCMIPVSLKGIFWEGFELSSGCVRVINNHERLSILGPEIGNICFDDGIFSEYCTFKSLHNRVLTHYDYYKLRTIFENACV